MQSVGLQYYRMIVYEFKFITCLLQTNNNIYQLGFLTFSRGINNTGLTWVNIQIPVPEPLRGYTSSINNLLITLQLKIQGRHLRHRTTNKISEYRLAVGGWYRSSRLQMLYKISVLKNFAKFTGKHLCWSLFFRGLQLYLKNDTDTGVFL